MLCAFFGRLSGFGAPNIAINIFNEFQFFMFLLKSTKDFGNNGIIKFNYMEKFSELYFLLLGNGLSSHITLEKLQPFSIIERAF